jgi:hypothetical protein
MKAVETDNSRTVNGTSSAARKKAELDAAKAELDMTNDSQLAGTLESKELKAAKAYAKVGVGRVGVGRVWDGVGRCGSVWVGSVWVGVGRCGSVRVGSESACSAYGSVR